MQAGREDKEVLTEPFRNLAHDLRIKKSRCSVKLLLIGKNKHVAIIWRDHIGNCFSGGILISIETLYHIRQHHLHHHFMHGLKR